MKRVQLNEPMLVVMQRAMADAKDLPLESGQECHRARRWIRQELAKRRKGTQAQTDARDRAIAKHRDVRMAGQ